MPRKPESCKETSTVRHLVKPPSEFVPESFLLACWVLKTLMNVFGTLSQSMLREVFFFFLNIYISRTFCVVCMTKLRPGVRLFNSSTKSSSCCLPASAGILLYYS